ncbi:hypothetical protein FRC04_004110 [Tulasnella sp. 424]|nr:hypothetical protein FRC04_004110 [Tulasnella sp. 424]
MADRLSKIMDDLAGVIDEMASGSEAKGAFALACAKMTAWRQVEDALRGRASQDLRARNALLPVHQLPVEVRAGIFEMAVADQLAGTYYQRLKSLGTVCYLWRRVIDYSPWMLTRIQGSDQSRIVEEALEKSANNLLDVSMHLGLWFTPDMLSPFLDRLDPHVNRLKSIEISYSKYKIPEYWITTVKLLTTPQPSLTLLPAQRISSGKYLEVTLLADQAPRLKDLQIYGMRINCQGAICAGLRTLSLRQVTVPSSKDLLSIIQCCCHLLDLELENIRSQTADTADPSPERISLPLLRHLFLGKVPSVVKERLLDDVYMAQSVHISLDLGADLGEPKDFVARHVSRWLSQRTPSLPVIAGIHVKPASSGLVLRFLDPKDSECFHLSLRHARSASTSLAILTGVNALLKAFAPKADTHLVLGQDSFVLAEDGDYMDQLSWLPFVTQLEMGESWHSTYFGYWEEESAKDFKLPVFPGLQELYLYQLPPVWIVKVVRMLLVDTETQPTWWFSSQYLRLEGFGACWDGKRCEGIE